MTSGQADQIGSCASPNAKELAGDHLMLQTDNAFMWLISDWTMIVSILQVEQATL